MVKERTGWLNGASKKRSGRFESKADETQEPECTLEDDDSE